MYTSRMMVYLNIGGFNHHLGYFSCGINCKHHITWLFRFSNVYYIIQKLECNSHHIYSLYAMSNNSIHALHSLFVNCRRKNKRQKAFLNDQIQIDPSCQKKVCRMFLFWIVQYICLILKIFCFGLLVLEN